MILHKGTHIPQLKESLHPDDIDWVWFSWRKTLGVSSITATSWSLPNSWNIVSQSDVTSVADISDGITYTNANGVLLDVPTTASGVNTVTNHVWLSDSRYLNRSVKINVEPL